jgi:SynChlorMet cassette radical SAM/SPASM protein ScmE
MRKYVLLNRPKEIEIAITNRCNLTCKYCSNYRSPAYNHPEFTLQIFEKFMHYLMTNRIKKVVLTGGEPFIREDIFGIISVLHKYSIRFSILTNGTLITENISQFIASTNLCDKVQISIDGADAETHDSFCGKGSFDAAINGLQFLIKNSINVRARITIHKKNVYKIREIVSFVLNDLKIKSLSTNSASFLGKCKRNSRNIQLSVPERQFAMMALVDLTKQYPNRVLAASGPLADAIIWTQMEKARSSGKKGFKNCGQLSGCGCTYYYLSVRADGTIVPCLHLSHIELGNIERDELLTVWQSHPNLKSLRERVNIPLTEIKFCEGCGYLPFCTGNCPAIPYNMFGDLNHPNPHDCLRNFFIDGGSVQALYK